MTVDVAAWSTPDGPPVWLLVVTCPCGRHDTEPPAAYAVQIVDGRAIVAPAARALPAEPDPAPRALSDEPAPPTPAPAAPPAPATSPTLAAPAALAAPTAVAAPTMPGAPAPATPSRPPNARPSTALPRILTPQERGVAELVRQGMTNREIGARLFSSPHTVNYHLRHIYRKLGVRNRVELTAVLAGLDEGQLSATAASSS